MHIPSERIYHEMNSEEASLWYVPANGGDELAFLIKAPTSSIKALIAGCSLKLFFGKKDNYLCIGVKILDMPDSPVFISGLQREAEEHRSLIRAFKEKTFPVFLFNEMDICLAWTNIKLVEEDTYGILDFLEPENQLYTGHFTKEASHVLDCFCYSVDNTNTYEGAHTILTREINVILGQWRTSQNYFYSVRSSHAITIDEKNEGETFERVIWASLESVFPMTLYKSPQIKTGAKIRELTDVFTFYPYGSFLIEAKDLSVLNSGYDRDQKRRTAGVQKQVKKAIAQLIGASKAFKQGETIFEDNGAELHVDRKQPSHCIVLILLSLCIGAIGKKLKFNCLKPCSKPGRFSTCLICVNL